MTLDEFIGEEDEEGSDKSGGSSSGGYGDESE